MSRVTQWIIGLISLAACFLSLFYAELPEETKLSNPELALKLMGGFWGIVAIACLVPRSRPVTLRLLGMSVFFLYSVGFAKELATTSWFRSLFGFISIGIPSGILAIYGRYPRWGWHAWAFQPSEDLAPKSRLQEDAIPSWMTSTRMTDIDSEQK